MISKISIRQVFFSFVLIGLMPFYGLAKGSGSGSSTSTGTSTGTGTSGGGAVASGSMSSPEDLMMKADSNGDGTVTQDEVMDVIDKYFDGESSFKVNEIMSLIDQFFDQ